MIDVINENDIEISEDISCLNTNILKNLKNINLKGGCSCLLYIFKGEA